MHCSLNKLFLLFVFSNPAILSPLQQSPLQPLCMTDEVEINEDVEYGYKGPEVYYITSFADQYHASLGTNGTGEGASLVTWY